MKASKFTNAQKAFIINQGVDGTSVAEICLKKIQLCPDTTKPLPKLLFLPLPAESQRAWPLRVTVTMATGGLLSTTDASAATPKAVFDLIATATPLGRVTTPDAALFFASPW